MTSPTFQCEHGQTFLIAAATPAAEARALRDFAGCGCEDEAGGGS